MKAKNKNGTDGQVKYKPFLIIFLIVIIMEIFLFNWRFFEGSEHETTDLYEFTCGSGVTVSDNGEIKIESSGDKWIEFAGLDTDIDNVYIDVRDKRNDDESLQRNGIGHDFQKVAIVISVTDEANAQYIDLPERVIAEGVERTKYIKMHTAGKSDKLKIKFNGVDNQILQLNSVAVNKQVPFSLSIIRICFFFALFVLAYLVRFGSKLYDVKFNVKSSMQNGITVALVAFNIIIAFGTALTNPQFVNIEMSFHQQYQRLTDAFLNGHVYLDYDEPPQALIDMENPYDTNERSRVMSENGTSARWDHAYYNGKYYVYYGALPVLTYYLPYKVITGEDFPTHMGVLINISLFIIFSFAFMRALVKKLFKNI
ncbi:MAG: hypothetical protein LUH47_05015 [Clostridiales bacterium]|nr:hypothetical protein [Clostridiales bacterium]